MIILLYILMCFIFGTTFLFIKLGLSVGWSPMLFASLRFSIAGILVLGVMFLYNQRIPKSIMIHKELVLVSLLMTTIPFSALYHSEQYISSGMAAILVATAPIFILLFNHLINKSKILFLQIIGIALCLVGILLIVLPNLGFDHNLIQFRAQASLLLTEMAFAYGSIRAKKLLDKKINPFVFNGLQMFYGGVLLLLLGFLSSESFMVPGKVSGWIIMIYFIVVASIIANGIYYWLMKKTNALFPSTWTYVSPVIAMVLGSIILDEEIGLRGIIGAIFILIGVIFTNVELVDFFKKRRKMRTLSVKFRG